VFIVPQVDEEGYVLTDAYVEAVKSFYKEDVLKTLVAKLAPDCIKGANAGAKGRCKAQQIYFQIFPQNILPQLFHFPRPFRPIVPLSMYKHHYSLLHLIMQQLQYVM
jgi:hypothetical protein